MPSSVVRPSRMMVTFFFILFRTYPIRYHGYTLSPFSSRRFAWWFSDEVTPGPIPNPVVKLVCADGTGGASPWESRSLPGKPPFSFPYPILFAMN